jgi:transketolase N-terminal domain/subunit
VLDNRPLNNLSETYPILAQVDSPADLRALDESQLPELAAEIRAFLLQTLAQTGGHLASGLGSVEITIALHYLFDTPHDRLVWDVGHQCYPHKILTGRRDRMPSMRQKGGLSGFPKISESEYDHFGAGHSSTSISAALGMAIAATAQGIERKTVAIIGDGGMTAGMAYEALNHGGAIDNDLLVILNDNEMSISPNVGAMSKYLSSIWSGKIYSSLRSGSRARVFLFWPDRRAQPGRFTLLDTQSATAVRTAHVAHRHAQRTGLSPGGRRCLQVSWRRSFRSLNRRFEILEQTGHAGLYQHLFRLAGRQGTTGFETACDNARNA